MAERWMAHPHLITAFGDGAGQYGPLHLYLVGLATTVFVDREMAGRLLSLLCGVLTVVPLYKLGRRSPDGRPASLRALALAVWGLHVQFSTTAASESVALLLMLSALAAFVAALETGRSAESGLGRRLGQRSPRPFATTRGCTRRSSLPRCS